MVASRESLNGDVWPELPSSTPDLPKLEARPTPLELAQAYATLAVHHGQLWPRVVLALEYLRGHLIGAKGEAAKASDEVRKLREELQGQRLSRELGLPSIRPEAPSSVDMAESIKTKVSGAFERIAKETKGPHLEADPKRLAAVVGAAVDEELARREAKKKADDNAIRLAAIDDAAKARKKNLKKIILAGLIAFATAGGTWSWGKLQGRVEGHLEGKSEGFEEGKKAASGAPISAPSSKK